MALPVLAQGFTATSRRAVCAARRNIFVGRDDIDAVVTRHRLRQVGAHVERRLDRRLLVQAIMARGAIGEAAVSDSRDVSCGSMRDSGYFCFS